MAYLAVQMSLYLAGAALIGICLGWLFWGRTHHRRIAKIHSEMTASLEAERELSDKTRLELQDTEAKLERMLAAEKANSEKAVTEVQKLLGTEKEATRTARSENEKLRLEMEAAIDAEKVSASGALQEALQDAERLKVEVEEGKTRETQIRAELEELRLMAGAEKLAAESARAEVEQLRAKMQTSIDVEREASRAARQALDDIHTTLTRTFGEGASVIAALDTQSEKKPIVGEAALISSSLKGDAQETDEGYQSGANDNLDEEIKPVKIIAPLESSGIDIEPGTAFDVPDEKATASEQTEQSNEQVVPIETSLTLESDGTAPLDNEDRAAPHHDGGGISEADQLDPPITLEPQPANQEKQVRPSSFYEERPSEVDSLQEIGGIDSSIEKLLNEQGCYHFKQLAHFSSDDIDWLVDTLPDVPDLKERIERDGWIEQARELQIKKYMTTNADRPRWWSRRRLQ